MRRSGPLALLVGALAVVALSTSAIRAQSPAEQQNLLPNGGFEDGRDGGLYGWVAEGATLERANKEAGDPVHSGDFAGKVTALGDGSFALLTKYWLTPVQPGAGYTLSLWLYTATDDPTDPEVSDPEVSLEFVDDEGGPEGVPAIKRITSPASGWHLVEIGPATAPPCSAHARVRVTAGPSGEGATFYVDSAELVADTPSPAPRREPAFFDSLINGDFELPGATPYGWRTHAGAVFVTAAAGSRAAALTSCVSTTAWLHQSFTVKGGRWYEVGGRLRPGAHTQFARIRVDWYASPDSSEPKLSTVDLEEVGGVRAAFVAVSSGAIRAPDKARSAQLRIMLRPAGAAPATLHADDLSFSRTAPPPTTTPRPPAPITPKPEPMPKFFAALTNGDFELPGKTPYGWRAHAGAVAFSSGGDARSVTLTSQGSSTAWLHQSFAVEGGRWYEAGGRLRIVSNAALARIRVAWYPSGDASGAQLATEDSDEIAGLSESFASVSTGAIRAPDEARSAQLRVMLRPASPAPAILEADDLSFARTAPPEREAAQAPPAQPSPTPEARPAFFPALTNGDFELPGDAPYGWGAHAGDALVTSEGGSRVAALASRGGATAWLHQSFAVEGGRWYELGGRLRPGADTQLARIRVAWYASPDSSGPQLSTVDLEELGGERGSFVALSSGPVRSPVEARSAQLRIMLRPAGEAPAILLADDLFFARTAPPRPVAAETPPPEPSAAPRAALAPFATLTNGDFELPGEAPHGWAAHGGDALVASEGGSRAAELTSRGGAAAWLHQTVAVRGGDWYEAAGRLRAGVNALHARIRVAWYASEDASGAQLSTADSDALEGGGDAFAAVSSGAIRAPDEARSAQLRIMLRPAGAAPAVLIADDVSFVPTDAPPPEPPARASGETAGTATPGAPPAAGATAVPPPRAAPEAVPAVTLEPYAARSASAIPLRITELLPDPPQSGADAEYEWIEVANVGASPVSLDGLILADNQGRIVLPALTLGPGGALVVAGARAEIGDAVALRLGGGLSNGLGNYGDRIALATPGGAIIDALSYGSDDSVDQPPLQAPPPGGSLQRRFDAAGRLIGAAIAERPSPGRIEAPVVPEVRAATEPEAAAAGSGEGEAGARMTPSSVESLRRQLDDTADWNRTAWIVLAAIAAIALAAAGAHRIRELQRTPPPARGRSPRRPRRWRRYASGAQVVRRALNPRRRRTPRA